MRTPRSIAFNDVEALAELSPAIGWRWPALLKPEQGGSGARIRRSRSLDELRAHVERTPGDLGCPTACSCSRSTSPHDPERGIVRMEFLGGELLYAMRVVSHGASTCARRRRATRTAAAGVCEVPPRRPAPPVEFYPYPGGAGARRSRPAKRIVRAGGIDVGGIEYLESRRRARLLRRERQLEPARRRSRASIRLRPVRSRRRLARAPRAHRARRGDRPRTGSRKRRERIQATTSSVCGLAGLRQGSPAGKPTEHVIRAGSFISGN